MKLRRVCISIGLVSFLSSPLEARPRSDLKAVVGFNAACGHPDKEAFFVAALLSAIIGPAVKAGVNALGSALQKAGAPDEANVSGQTSAMFFKVDDDPKKTDLLVQQSCVVVAVEGTSQDGALNPKAYPQEIARLMQTAQFRESPSFLMASGIEISADRTAWRLVPELLKVGSPLTLDSWARGNGRDLVATLSVMSPGVKEDDGVIATRAFKIDRNLIAQSPIGSPPLSEGLDYLATSWMPLPQPSEEIQNALKAASQRRSDRDALEKAENEAQKQAANSDLPAKVRQAARKKIHDAEEQLKTLDAAIEADRAKLKEVTPVTLKFAINETRDGNKFIASVGKFLSDNSEAIAKPIADRIDPSAYTAARVAAVTADDKLHTDAITAVAVWKASVASGEDASKQKIAKIEAQGACRILQLKGFAEPDCLDVQ